MRYFLLLIFIGIFLGCKKETPEYPQPLPEYRSVKVEVKHVYQVLPEVKDSAVPGANVKFYLSKEDMLDSTGFVADRFTDSNGIAWVQYLKEDFYYVQVQHTKFYTEVDSVSTPARTLSFVEIIYY